MGFEQAIKLSKYGEKAECIGYAEIDKYADSIYRRHFPEHRSLGDVTEIRTDTLPDFDLLVGGFPCQSFSIAGKRGGFSDTRGTLFFEIARILEAKRPRYFLLENVRNILSHNKGKTFQRILEILSNLRYNVTWQVYNSKNYGVPQNRERVYIKGYLRGQCGGEVLHFTGTDEESPREMNDIEIVGNFSSTNHWGGNIYSSEGICPTLCGSSVVKNGLHIKEDDVKLTRLNKGKHQAQTVYDPNGLACTLSANGGGDGGKTGLYLVPDEEVEWYDEKHNFRVVDDEKAVTTTKNGDCFSVTTRHRGMGLHKKQDNYVNYNNSRIRRLIPLETERLQGFEDNWTQYGADDEPISDTQRYKCTGNAITVNVVKYIMDNWDLNV